MDNTTTMDHAEFTARRSLPMMALRGLTVFPGMMLTFEVERSMSIAALNMAMSDDPDAGRAHGHALLCGRGRADAGCGRAENGAHRGAHPSLLQFV